VIKNLFRRRRSPEAAAAVAVDEPIAAKTPRTYDFGPGRRSYGHDVVIHQVVDGGRELHVSGWGPTFGGPIVAGDYLLLPNGEGTTRYQVAGIVPHADPADMWEARLTFAPRGRPA
jgi:hypothetical protein